MSADAAVMDASAEGKPTFIVFSDDWGEHMSSSQHLFRHIAREHAVVWVNTVGMRAPKLSSGDLVKVWRKLSRMFRSDRRRARVDEDLQLTVCHPFMLPYSGIGAVRAFNARSVARALRRTLQAGSNSSRTIVVATVPNAGDYCDAFSDAIVVYYCVDDFTQWPGMDVKVVQDMERRLIARADVLVAASVRLRDRLASSGKPAHLLTHGVDVEHFAQSVSKEHPCLNGIRTPRAGFFGLIDARVDQNLLFGIAQVMSEMSFVLVGPVEAPVQRLVNCANVHFTGPIPYQELPAVIKGLDVLLIPYAPGPLADSLSPLKLKEYRCTGKPIVSTPIAEAREQASHVAIAGTKDEWVRELQQALGVDTDSRRIAAVRSMHSEAWSCKARMLVELCTGPLRRQAPSSSRQDAGTVSNKACPV